MKGGHLDSDRVRKIPRLVGDFEGFSTAEQVRAEGKANKISGLRASSGGTCVANTMVGSLRVPYELLEEIDHESQ